MFTFYLPGKVSGSGLCGVLGLASSPRTGSWTGTTPESSGDQVTPRILLRLVQLLAGTLLGLAVAFWWLGRAGPVAEAEGPQTDYFLSQPLEAPDFSLTTHLGGTFSSEDARGKVLVVFFGYTSCPDVCPLTLSKLSEAFSLMGEAGARVQVLLVSVDPARDTPQRLESYLENFHPSFMGLTGTEEEIRRVADGFGAYFSANGTGEGYTVDHTARAFVVDGHGKIPLTFPVTASAEEMARDLSLLLNPDGEA